MRVGVVGAGWVTQYHLPAWRRLEGVEVVAICDPDPDMLAVRADAFGIAGRHDSLTKMLEAERLDAVDIASPRRFHAAHVREAVAAGLPVLCQKPLGVDLAEAERLVADIGGKVPLMVHENWRFRPWYRTFRGWLDGGAAGVLHAARLDFHSSGMLPDATGARPALVRQPFFRTEPRLLVNEVLIHHLDTLRFLLGEFDLVAGRLGRSNDEIVGEDRAKLYLERRDDRMPLAVSGDFSVHGAPAAPADQLSIWGSAGTITFDGKTLRLAGEQVREVAFDPLVGYQESYDAAIAHFVSALGSNQVFETNPRDNLETLRLVEAAYASSGFVPSVPRDHG